MPRRSAPRNEVVADRLHSAAIHLLRSLRRVDSESGLTAPRLSILSVLVFRGPRTLGELAEVEQVRPPTMTRLVTGLEEVRLVRRETDRQDRRVTLVHATTKGRKVMLAGRARRVADLTARLDRATKDELRQLEHAATVIERLAIS